MCSMDKRRTTGLSVYDLVAELYAATRDEDGSIGERWADLLAKYGYDVEKFKPGASR